MDIRETYTLRHGQVIITDFPYEDNHERKSVHPAYVVSVTPEGKVLALKITSHQKRTHFDFWLKYWKEANLNKPSTVRCNKPAYLDPESIHKSVGFVHSHEMRMIDKLYEQCCMEQEIPTLGND